MLIFLFGFLFHIFVLFCFAIGFLVLCIAVVRRRRRNRHPQVVHHYYHQGPPPPTGGV